MGQRHVRGVASLRNEDAPNPRLIVTRVEHMPAATEIDFDPCGKIIGRIGRRKARIGKVTGAVACWNVQTAAKSDGKMGIVTTHPAALLIRFKCSSGRTRMLVPECYVTMHEIADSLHPLPAQRDVSEKAPSLVGETIGLAITA